mgnify:CR=1 FL=1
MLILPGEIEKNLSEPLKEIFKMNISHVELKLQKLSLRPFGRTY